MKEPAHHALHPFGQIPTYEEGDLGLFEVRLQRGTLTILQHAEKLSSFPALAQCAYRAEKRPLSQRTPGLN
jgi:glutathione S-transferase